jgi:hypothetical protein
MQRAARWLVAACCAAGLADPAVAFQVEPGAAGTSRLAVLSISARTAGADAACAGTTCNGKKPDAKPDALRTAAATLRSSGTTTSIAGSPFILRTARDILLGLSLGNTPGTGDTLIRDGDNKGGSSVRNVASGWTLRPANAELMRTAASSIFLYNIANNGGVSWDGAVNSASGPQKKAVPGLLWP